MKKKKAILGALVVLTLAALAAAQTLAEPGFIITLKNGSTLKGRSLSREAGSGKLRLTMTESNGAEASYAVIAVEDTDSIRASSSDTESIRIRLLGGSELRCKEFTLSGDMISVKIGSASRVDVRWDQVASISFGQ